MAQPESSSALGTFWRATIMLGTLVVGGLAVLVYGPTPEKAAQLIDGVAERARELLTDADADTGVSQQPPGASAPQFATNSGRQPLAPPPLARPAGWPPLSAQPTHEQSEEALLKAQLQRLGAADLDVRPWGADGVLHRVQCSVALGGPAQFRRHVEAVGTSPAEALAMVLSEVQSLRWPSNANPTTRTAANL